MVFVSMASDEALDLTAQYHIMYSCPALRLPAFGRFQTNSQRHLNAIRISPRSTERTVLVNPGETYIEDSSTPGDQESTRQSSPDFHITMDQDDKSDDESLSDNSAEDRAAITEHLFTEDIEQLLYPVGFDTDDSDEDVNETPGSLLDEIRRQVRQSMGIDTDHLGARNRPSANNRGAPPDAPENVETAPSPAERVLTPHARFFIRRDKAAVTLKFDPPV